MIDAFVAKIPGIKSWVQHRCGFMRSMLVLSLLLLTLVSGPRFAFAASELDTRLAVIQGDVASLQTVQPAAFTRLNAQIDALRSTLTQLNLSGSVLMAGSTLSVKRGTTFNFNISILPGTSSSAGLEGTLITPTGWTLTSLTAGPAATAAGKTVSFNPQTGIFIIAGLNQTLIQGGVVAVASFKIPATAVPTLVPVSITFPSASDPNGNAISISEISGTVTVTP